MYRSHQRHLQIVRDLILGELLHLGHTTRIVRRGKGRRLKKSRLRHYPSGHGKGRWHSFNTLWASKLKDRRKRQVSAASRAANRAA